MVGSGSVVFLAVEEEFRFNFAGDASGVFGTTEGPGAVVFLAVEEEFRFNFAGDASGVFGTTGESEVVVFLAVEEEFRFNLAGDDFDVAGSCWLDIPSSPGRVRIISRRSSSEIISIFISRALFVFPSLASRPTIR